MHEFSRCFKINKMSSEYPYSNRENELIWKALDDYFSHVGQDSREVNIRLAKSSVDRWGSAFLLGGFSWVAESIEREGNESARMALMGMSDQFLNMKLFNIARGNFNRLRDIVTLSDKNIGASLAANVVVMPNEDEKALSAYMLASDFVPTLDAMKLEFSKSLLGNLYHTIEGTSCRMSVAWALYEMGDKDKWESLVYGNHFVKRTHLDMLEEFFKEYKKEHKEEYKTLLKGQDVKTVVCREYAVPGSTDSVPSYMIGDIGIFEMLTLDIASDGKAYRSYPNWQRKPKSIESNRG